jgi:hypothetical protein
MLVAARTEGAHVAEASSNAHAGHLRDRAGILGDRPVVTILRVVRIGEKIPAFRERGTGSRTRSPARSHHGRPSANSNTGTAKARSGNDHLIVRIFCGVAPSKISLC